MLFSNTSELKNYIQANAEFEFDNIAPILRHQGRQNIVHKYLGTTLSDSLHAAYSTNTLSPLMRQLLEKVRMPLANYALSVYIRNSMVNYTKHGPRITTSERDKTPFKWQLETARQSCLDAMYDGIESLLLVLEANSSQPELSSWATSPAFTQSSNRLVRNADEFQQYFNIDSNRRTFHAMRSCLSEAEDAFVTPLLGIPYLTLLKNEFQSNSVTSLNQPVLVLAQRALVLHTIALATARLPFSFSADGIRLVASSEREDFISITPAEQERIADLRKQSVASAEAAIASLNAILYASPDDYLTWKNSDAYKPDSDTGFSGQSGQSVVAF